MSNSSIDQQQSDGTIRMTKYGSRLSESLKVAKLRFMDGKESAELAL